MENYIDTIASSRLFKNISKEEILKLLKNTNSKISSFKKGEYVFFEGDIVEDIALLVDGALHIQSDDFWGNRYILGKINKREIFAESYAFLNNQKLLNDVQALEDSKVMFINVQKLLNYCLSSENFQKEVINNLLIIFAFKNQNLVQKLRTIAKRSIREKLLFYFSLEAKIQNFSTIKLSFNRQELANYLFVDRSALSRELSKMQKDGLIIYKKNTIKLLKL